MSRKTEVGFCHGLSVLIQGFRKCVQNINPTVSRNKISASQNKENRQDLVALLLHGSAFSSRTWESIGTLEFLKSNMSLSAIAVDLPSYKDSKSVPVPKNKLAYLINMIFELEVFDDKSPGFLLSLLNYRIIILINQKMR